MELRWLGIAVVLGLVGCGSEPGSGGAGGSGGGAGAAIAQVSIGSAHTCAISVEGELKCWGDNSEGQLGRGDVVAIGDDELPSSVRSLDLGAKAVSVACGASHTCAVLEGGGVKCWGANAAGQLGYGTTTPIGDDEVLSGVGLVDLGGPAKQVVAGGDFSCALLATGDVRCWGGARAALGLGHLEAIGDDEVPVAVGIIDLGGKATALTSSVFHVCALMESQNVRCWGWERASGYQGQAIGDDETPAQAGDLDLGGPVISVSAAAQHTCAVMEGGGVRCWGTGDDSQLGYGNTNYIGDDETPASVGDVPFPSPVAQVAVGRSHSCVRTDAGVVSCWGAGSGGALGNGNANPVISAASANPVKLAEAVESLVSGNFSVCGLMAGGMTCWGAGSSGQLGYGNTDNVGVKEVPEQAGFVPVF